MKRTTLTQVSARKFIELVHERANAQGCAPNKVCGISKATFHRWKNGSYPIPLRKSLTVAQKTGIDENLFLGKVAIAEALIADKKDDLEKQVLLFEHFAQLSENDGKTDSLFQVARIIQSKLVTSGHHVLLTCEQQSESSRTRLVVSKPGNQDQVLLLTVFGEQHQIFCVLENAEGHPFIGLNATHKNLRKLIRVLHQLFDHKQEHFDLDTVAKNLINRQYA